MVSGGSEAQLTAREVFCRQVRTRSAENSRAIWLLQSQDLPAQAVGILRQELDSLVRVIYLLSTDDKKRREELMQASTEGRMWTLVGSRKSVTDRDMVNLA